jgi:hypothetical protein
VTFLKELREQARTCTHKEYKVLLFQLADRIALGIELLAADPTTENMKDLNGLWAVAARALDDAPTEGGPNGGLSIAA